MKYYTSECGKLIQFNPETNVYKIRNSIEKTDKRLSLEEFNQLNTKSIKMPEFSRLMNIYFKNIKHSWVHNETNYRKLDNFETKDYNLSVNYVLGKDVPYHELENKKYLGNLILVYHWGKIYYFTISYNGYEQGQLIDPYTLELVRWAQLKHCSPIFNEGTKKIV